MADCSASGTALDRVIQLAVASSSNQGNNGVASVAGSAATAAYTNFLGGTAATASSSAGNASMLGGVLDAGRHIMPLSPLETLGGNAIMVQHRHVDGASTSAAQMDRAWAATASGAADASVKHIMMQRPQQRMQQDNMMPMQGQMMQMNHQTSPHHHVMMQQQQMMMMQQMQMQQHQMAAMVQYQKQHQQHQRQQQELQRTQKMMEGNRQQASSTNEAEQSKSRFTERTPQYEPDIESDDVATVSEEDQFHHEGFTSDASIERLAQAWRDAEAEYAHEFDELEDDNYDASDMGGMYADEYYQSAASATSAEATTEPQYNFSEASQNYGCIQTTTTDIAPLNLSYPDNLFEQGIQQFDEGNISEAILCFESTLRNIDPEHADAWRMLGKCHTEHDEDQKAIVCWLRSLERDPFSPETLLALGVAYVNELDHEKAIETLKNWVANHPLYAGMVDDNVGVNNRLDRDGEEDLYGNPDDGTSPTDARQRMRPRTVVEMRDVERLLLRALEYDRTDDAAADVYEALGVVYNVSRDYDAAANAFRRAIDVRPMDYQLRNKLGATLANSNRSDEALPFYRAALSLKPKYARGWLNMAISHSNLHNYDEAVRCYLQTLSLNPDARHVWSYLRIALTCSEKWDLLGFAASQNLRAFHDHYDFVEY